MDYDSSTKPTIKGAFSDHGFSDISPEHDHAYRSVSRIAVFALVLGLLSPLALVHPIAWALPWTGVVVGWHALRRVSLPNSVVSGRAIAALGLFCTVLFSVWSPTKYLVERHLITSQARQFADTWLELVRDGNIQEAHRWMLPPYQRAADMPTQVFYEQFVHLQEDLESEFTAEPLNLIASQPNSTIQFTARETIDGDALDQGIVLKYVLHRDDDVDTDTNSNTADHTHVHADTTHAGHTHAHVKHPDIDFFVRVRRLVTDGQTNWQISQVYKPA